MRIEYKILWVEDDRSWYKTTQELFSDSLEELGFKLLSTRCENIDDVKNEIKLNGLKDYDMLLVDYTLRNSDSGDKVIKFIRDIKTDPIFTDVLFYSTKIQDVINSMHKLGLEGVYTADRIDVEIKFNHLVKTTLKKIQEVNTMRGLIMAETCDLDQIMIEIIQKLLETEISEKMATYIHGKMKKTIDSLADIVIAPETNISEKIKDSRIFMSSHKAQAITQLYKLKKIGMKNFYESYNTEVISPRNIFGHVNESIEKGKKVLVSHATGKKEVFSEERCIEIRQSLIRYRDILEEINDKIKDGI